MYKKIFSFLVIFSVFLFNPAITFALENTEPQEVLEVQDVSLMGAKNTFFEGNFSLIFPKDYFSAPSSVEVKKLTSIIADPWRLNRVSEVYQYDLKNAAYQSGKQFKLEIKYDKTDKYYKQIYFFDKNKSAWRPLKTSNNFETNTVSALITFPFAKIAVFSDHNILVEGKASWYKYKNGNFAASPDFPKGTKLKITSVQKFSKKATSIEVVVNDYGPDKLKHPERAVDLDKVAFNKIAPTGEGVIDVFVEPIFIPDNGASLNLTKDASVDFKITSPSAIILDETGAPIFEKNADRVMPLASLTKIVTASVFLDSKISLSTEIAYKKQDENYNYEYCEEWESARLKVGDGEKMTLENLLYASVMASANNATESLVRASGLTREEFIVRMNEKVKSWGALSTHFVEPTGLSPENMTTARDYAIIAKEALSNPLLSKISTAKSYSFATLDTKKKHNLKNTNPLILASNLKLTGSKTGYLEEAKNCLMAQMVINGKKYTAVVLGADNRTASANDIKDIFFYTQEKLKK